MTTAKPIRKMIPIALPKNFNMGIPLFSCFFVTDPLSYRSMSANIKTLIRCCLLLPELFAQLPILLSVDGEMTRWLCATPRRVPAQKVRQHSQGFYQQALR